MANENVRNLRDGTIILQDNAAVNTLTIICEEGDLSWSETYDVKQIKDRNRLCMMRLGEEEPISLAFSIHYKYSKAQGAEPLSPYEVFHHQHGAAAWVTTNICGDVHTLDIRFVMVDPCGGTEPETILFERVPLPGISFEEGDESNSLSFDGIAFLAKPTITRQTTTSTTVAATTTTTLA